MPRDLRKPSRPNWCVAIMLAMYGSDTGLIPNGTDCEVLAPFLSLTMSTLNLLGIDPVVRQYVSAAPEAHRAIRELSAAMAAAGVRVRDTTRRHDFFDEHIREFTPEEIWMFDLAIDVIAMLGTLGGLSPGTHAQILDDLRSLDRFPHNHHWQKEVRKAGDGPAVFRELRAHVPHHKPHPG
jgi:hypothetical protein